jgi:hypothetical protein
MERVGQTRLRGVKLFVPINTLETTAVNESVGRLSVTGKWSIVSLVVTIVCSEITSIFLDRGIYLKCVKEKWTTAKSCSRKLVHQVGS